MKTLMLFLLPIIFIVILFQNLTISAEPITLVETAILQLRDTDYLNWKEISRNVNKREGFVELIPNDQTSQTWSELICVQYLDFTGRDPKIMGIGAFVGAIQNTTLAAYPGNRVSWTIIEKNKDDIIYEWILHKPFKNIPPQHEIARAFLTENKFHRIGITRKNHEMTEEERQTWLKLLKESTSVVSFEEAVKIKGISLVPRSSEKN